MCVQSLGFGHADDGIAEAVEAFLAEFLIGDGVHEAVEADAAVGAGESHGGQGVVGT